jgi:hypothetical protein
VHAAHRGRAAGLAVGPDVLAELVDGGLAFHDGYTLPLPNQ